MMRIALALGLMLIAPASAQEQIWIRQFGTATVDDLWALAADGDGGVYAGGSTWGSLAGLVAGGNDAWLARYDGAGTLIWVRQFGSSAQDELLALALREGGGVFAAGRTKGALGAPFAGVWDAWLAGHDESGTQLWARQLGTSADDRALAAAGDGAGGVFVGGSTQGVLGSAGLGSDDAWLARYDGAGNQVWLRQFGTSVSDGVTALAADGGGGFFAGGWTDGALGGPWGGMRDAWIAHYDSAGNALWIRQLGTNYPDYLTSVAIDGQGGVYVAGAGEGAFVSANLGETDTFLARYDGTGTRLWIRQWGTETFDDAYALAPDGVGGVFIGGRTWGNLGGPVAGPAPDAWLARYDAQGARRWIHQFGTVGSDYAYSLAPRGVGQVFFGGSTWGTLGGPHMGFRDAWLARFGEACYADCNKDGALNLADFGCFQNRFALQDTYADCNGDGALNLADFGCFQTKFSLGCP